ncbi:hypothetical protein E2C01_034159 [Portunus trituberculatus]|uniref:Uncharacterized protein n=1 Tax=Portunus trituberculatus TaxID=210409 RepID=A0A5B7F503_PORTR|nr:hypothetical protein [Portunus trituberculatus]
MKQNWLELRRDKKDESKDRWSRFLQHVNASTGNALCLCLLGDICILGTSLQVEAKVFFYFFFQQGGEERKRKLVVL